MWWRQFVERRLLSLDGFLVLLSLSSSLGIAYVEPRAMSI